MLIFMVTGILSTKMYALPKDNLPPGLIYVCSFACSVLFRPRSLQMYKSTVCSEFLPPSSPSRFLVLRCTEREEWIIKKKVDNSSTNIHLFSRDSRLFFKKNVGIHPRFIMLAVSLSVGRTVLRSVYVI